MNTKPAPSAPARRLALLRQLLRGMALSIAVPVITFLVMFGGYLIWGPLGNLTCAHCWSWLYYLPLMIVIPGATALYFVHRWKLWGPFLTTLVLGVAAVLLLVRQIDSLGWRPVVLGTVCTVGLASVAAVATSLIRRGHLVGIVAVASMAAMAAAGGAVALLPINGPRWNFASRGQLIEFAVFVTWPASVIGAIGGIIGVAIAWGTWQVRGDRGSPSGLAEPGLDDDLGEVPAVAE